MVDTNSLLRAAEFGVYPITKVIVIGWFATAQRATAMRSLGITHVLNVAGMRSLLSAEVDGLTEIVWHPLADNAPLPIGATLSCLDTLHRLANSPGSRVYLHCVAGQNRSPTIAWLYLVACGMAPDAARVLIEERMLDAIPGHSALVYEELLQAVRQHGETHFSPLARPEVLVPD